MIKTILKIWGKEEWFVNTDLYCCKKLYFNRGCSCSTQYHKLKDETLWLLKGEVKVELLGKTIYLKEGNSTRIKPNNVHRITAVVDSIILEVSTHHEDSDTYSLQEGKGNNNIETSNEEEISH